MFAVTFLEFYFLCFPGKIFLIRLCSNSLLPPHIAYFLPGIDSPPSLLPLPPLSRPLFHPFSPPFHCPTFPLMVFFSFLPPFQFSHFLYFCSSLLVCIFFILTLPSCPLLDLSFFLYPVPSLLPSFFPFGSLTFPPLLST